MNDWTPGEGWTMQQFEDEVPNGVIGFREDDGSWTYWVRHELVPPLPTNTYTVIHVNWKPDISGWNDVRTLLPERSHGLEPSWDGLDIDFVQNHITGFEVLSEPRAVTAKAIFSRLREYNGLVVGESDEFDSIAREFGVDS